MAKIMRILSIIPKYFKSITTVFTVYKLVMNYNFFSV